VEFRLADFFDMVYICALEIDVEIHCLIIVVDLFHAFRRIAIAYQSLADLEAG